MYGKVAENMIHRFNEHTLIIFTLQYVILLTWEQMDNVTSLLYKHFQQNFLSSMLKSSANFFLIQHLPSPLEQRPSPEDEGLPGKL